MSGVHILDEPIFGEPPIRKGQERWEAAIAKLKANPGQWAVIATGWSGPQRAVLLKWWPTLDVRTTGRSGETTAELWARWTEEDEEI